MTSKGVFVLITVCFLASCSGNGNNFGEKVKQVSIHRVDSMPDMPETYKMLDWKQKAQKYDQFIFDWNNKSEVGPLIWLDDARRNIDSVASLFCYIFISILWRANRHSWFSRMSNS